MSHTALLNGYFAQMSFYVTRSRDSLLTLVSAMTDWSLAIKEIRSCPSYKPKGLEKPHDSEYCGASCSDLAQPMLGFISPFRLTNKHRSTKVDNSSNVNPHHSTTIYSDTVSKLNHTWSNCKVNFDLGMLDVVLPARILCPRPKSNPVPYFNLIYKPLPIPCPIRRPPTLLLH